MRYKTNKQEMIFFLIYIIYIIAVLADYTVFSENSMYALIFKGMRYFCYFFAAIKVIRDSYYNKEFLEVLFVLACIILTVLFSGNKTFAFYFLMILSAKDINIRKIIKMTCYVQVITLLLCVGLSQVGILQDYIFDPNGRGRHGLGFVWTTTAPILFFFFMMSYIYLRKEKMHTLEFIILEVLNYWLFIKTDARMSFYLSSLMLVFVFVMRFYWQNRDDIRMKNKILVLAPVFMCCVALVLHAAYDSSSESWNALNSLLSGRLALGYNGLEEYGMTLFGQPIRWIGFSHSAASGTYNYVDCSYLQILLENGIVSLVVVVLAYIYIMFMAVKVKDFYLQTIILFIVTFSITEPRLMNLGFNPFPFLAVGVFCGANGEKLFKRCDCSMPGINWKTPHVVVKMRR